MKQEIYDQQCNQKTDQSQKQTSEIGCQTEIINRDYIPTYFLKSLNLESQQNFIQMPHSILGLFFIIIILILGKSYYSFDLSEKSLILNGHIGLYFSFLTIIIYAMIYFPNTIFQRPHPIFWRIVHAIGMIWLLLICFANAYNKQDLQTFLQVFVDKNLGQPLKERSYAENCEFYTPGHLDGNFAHFTGAIDIYVSAHVIGWIFKTLVVRDLKMCILQSVIFELVELTFRHWLNNFYECWWDSIILDIFICNTTGMLIGLFIIDTFKLKKYTWSLRKKNDKSYFQNLKEITQPSKYINHNWEMLNSTKQFLLVSFMALFSQMIEINFFFNKFALSIETSHPLCAFRTFLVGFLGMPATREYYELITNPNIKRLGPYCWNMFAIIAMEILLFINNADWEKFKAPFPWFVKLIWFVIFIVYALVLSFIIYNDIFKKSKLINVKEEIKKINIQ